MTRSPRFGFADSPPADARIAPLGSTKTRSKDLVFVFSGISLLIIREVFAGVEGLADCFIIPEDGQLIADFKHGIR